MRRNICKHLVKDKITKRGRRCKKRVRNGKSYCFIHNTDNLQSKYNNCCYCNEQCNPLSQSCGRCARIIGWY